MPKSHIDPESIVVMRVLKLTVGTVLVVGVLVGGYVRLVSVVSKRGRLVTVVEVVETVVINGSTTGRSQIGGGASCRHG